MAENTKSDLPEPNWGVFGDAPEGLAPEPKSEPGPMVTPENDTFSRIREIIQAALIAPENNGLLPGAENTSNDGQ